MVPRSGGRDPDPWAGSPGLIEWIVRALASRQEEEHGHADEQKEKGCR